jgi:hypothetical protein
MQELAPCLWLNFNEALKNVQADFCVDPRRRG